GEGEARVHPEGDRDEERHGGRAPDAGQDPEEKAEEHAGDHERRSRPGEDGQLEQHRMLLAAPGVPDCARDILEGALEDALASDGFQEQADEAQLAVRFASAADSAEIMASTLETFTEYREEIEEAQN